MKITVAIRMEVTNVFVRRGNLEMEQNKEGVIHKM